MLLEHGRFKTHSGILEFLEVYTTCGITCLDSLLSESTALGFRDNSRRNYFLVAFCRKRSPWWSVEREEIEVRGTYFLHYLLVVFSSRGSRMLILSHVHIKTTFDDVLNT